MPVRPPVRTVESTVDASEEEEVEDDVTWAASGSPYLHRENTAEVGLYDEEGANTTNEEWNPGSAPFGHGSSDDTLGFDVRPSTSGFGDAGLPTDNPPTHPGFGADGTLSALRDAMRGGPPTRRRPAPPPPHHSSAHSSGMPLPMPSPRTNPGIRAPAPPAPIRRVAPRPAAAPAPPPPRARITPAGRRARPTVLSILAPVVLTAVAMLFVGAIALQMSQQPDVVDIAAPMLPVVGGPAPKSPPAPPFDLAPPAAYRPVLLEGVTAEVEDLPVRLTEARFEGNHALAAAWSDRLVRLDGSPERFYLNGQLLSEVREPDAALYWLVRAEQEHGFPPQWLVEQRAFRHLWVDPRWDAFIRWMILSQRHHAARGTPPTSIAVPRDLEAAAAKEAARHDTKVARIPKEGPTLPVVIWLDQIGGNGSGALAWGQDLADQLGVIVVGMGGPERIGPAGSWWTSDPARDRQHVDHALAAVPGAVPDPAQRFLVGVGQGAQYAVELVLRDATFARGALALAPTDEWRGARDKAGEGARDRQQHVVLAAGGKVPDIHTLMRMDMGRLKRAGVEVELGMEAAPWTATPPEDVASRITRWLLARIDPKAALAEGAELAVRTTADGAPEAPATEQDANAEAAPAAAETPDPVPADEPTPVPAPEP